MPKATSKAEYVRLTTLFKNDEEYTPDKARRAWGATLKDEYLDALTELVENAKGTGALRMSAVEWKGDDGNIVISGAAVEPRNGNGSGKKGKGGNKRIAKGEDRDDL